MKHYQTVSIMFIPVEPADLLTVSDSDPFDCEMVFGESGTGISVSWGE